MFPSVRSLMAKRLAVDHGAATLFLLLLNALYFFPVLAQGNGAILSLRGTDAWYQFFFWRYFAYDQLMKGVLPLWNPYVFSGTPFLAGIQSALFYPLNLLFLLFPTPFAINLSIALHCFLASFFTYCYARYLRIEPAGSILSGVCFAYGAPFFLHVLPGHLAPLSTMIWLPLLFWGVEGFLGTGKVKFMLLSGIVAAVQLCAGSPQYLFYSVLTVSIYLWGRAIVKREVSILALIRGYGVFVVTGFLLAAAQWLPTAELVENSFRENLSFEWVSLLSLPPANLVTLLIPDFFGNGLDVTYWGDNYLWEMSVYIGVVPMALALTALIFDRREGVLTFSLIAGISLILALGKYTPLLKILYDLVPGFDRFRGLSKFVFVFSFAAAMLAGFGLSQVSRMTENQDRRLARLPYVFFGLPIFLFFIVVATPLSDADWWRSLIQSYAAAEIQFIRLPPITDMFVTAVMSGAFRSLLTSCGLLAALGACLLAFAKRREWPRFLPAALVLLAAVDLWHFGVRYLVTFSPQQLRMDHELKSYLMRDTEPFRIASPLEEFLNIGLYERIENVGGYDSLVLKRYSEFINLAQGTPLTEPNTDTRVRVFSPLLNFLNAKYFIVDGSTRIDHPALGLDFENASYRVYRNRDVLPRSFIVHNFRVIHDEREILRQMASPAYNPAAAAIVEENVDSLPSDANTRSPAPEFIERSLNRLVLDATLNGPGLLVLGDVFYPGWRGFVDGEETTIYRANYIMRAVVVPRGRHRVEFRYDPRSLKIGAAISLATLLGLSGWLLWAGRKRSKR